MGLLSRYALIGEGIAALGMAGSLYVQSSMIHSWHVKYDTDEKTIAVLNDKIKGMTTAQNTQTGKTEGNVIRVVQGPKEVDTIIKEINSTTSKPCTAPVDTDEVKNAF